MGNRQEKIDFVISYLIKHPVSVDIMNRDFVEQYIEEFKAPHMMMIYSADRCPQLSRLLKSMYDAKLLTRKRVGIQCGYSGSPKWVYCYELPPTSKSHSPNP